MHFQISWFLSYILVEDKAISCHLLGIKQNLPFPSLEMGKTLWTSIGINVIQGSKYMSYSFPMTMHLGGYPYIFVSWRETINVVVSTSQKCDHFSTAAVNLRNWYSLSDIPVVIFPPVLSSVTDPCQPNCCAYSVSDFESCSVHLPLDRIQLFPFYLTLQMFLPWTFSWIFIGESSFERQK